MSWFRRITAEKICKAYNNSRHHLRAVESGCGCMTGKHWTVANEMVVLRQMLEKLGFSNPEIEKWMHKK